MRNFCRFFIAVAFLLFGLTTFAASDGYEIKVKINGLSNEEIFLAYHYGDKQYMKDTIMLDSKGVGTFKGDEPLPGGFYLIVLPQKTYFEVIVNKNQHFSVENDTVNFQEKFKSKGTIENEIFYEDMKFMAAKHEERQQLKEEEQKFKDNKKKSQEIKEKIEKLDNEVRAHREKIEEEHPDSFYAKFLRSLEEPEMPESVKDKDGNPIDSLWYKYYKAHYFDNIDLADDRMLRTPTLHSRVMNYINKVVYQIPDSLSAACDVILQAAKPNDEMFKYWCITLLNKFANSKVMCMEAVYVHLVNKYYATEDAYWVDDEDLFRIKDRAEALSHTLCNEKAPNMFLRDVNNNVIPLYSVDAKYTMVYIYAPDCGHCKKQTPLFLKAYEKIVDTMGIDLKVYATPTLNLFEGEYDEQGDPIYNEERRSEWTDFIKKFKIGRWINVADLYLHDNFRELYDVQSTPKVFLLDKNKKIIAKRFTADQLILIIKETEQRKPN